MSEKEEKEAAETKRKETIKNVNKISKEKKV